MALLLDKKLLSLDMGITRFGGARCARRKIRTCTSGSDRMTLVAVGGAVVEALLPTTPTAVGLDIRIEPFRPAASEALL